MTAPEPAIFPQTAEYPSTGKPAMGFFKESPEKVDIHS